IDTALLAHKCSGSRVPSKPCNPPSSHDPCLPIILGGVVNPSQRRKWMRKSAGLWMAVALTAVMASSAGAASSNNMMFGITGGAAVPTGDFSDAASTGFNFGGTGTLMLNQSWGVGADVAYHMWNGSDDLNAGTQALLGDPSAEWKFSAIQGT